MNALTHLLQDADPLRHEGPRLDTERERLLAVIMAAKPTAPRVLRRAVFTSLAALVAVSVAAVLFAYASGIPWTVPVAAQMRFEVRLAEERPVPGLVVAQVGNTGRVIYLHPETVVNNDDIASAVVMNDGAAGFTVEVQFLSIGADRMRQATGAHIGRPLAILLDGHVAMAPTLRSPIGDSAVISGDFTESEAKRIAEGVSRR